MGIGLSLRSFARKDVGNDRVHGNLLIEIDITLLDYRFRSFSQGKKTASPSFPDCFVGDVLSAPRHALAPIGRPKTARESRSRIR
jgi:hypothetical protein